jgi:ferric-dicitrate binding protein FerR (iron transport regulator)
MGFQAWLEVDRNNALAYREVGATWALFGSYASSPPIIRARRDALNAACRRQSRYPIRSQAPRLPR